jgi:small-conductance mechanosensitive channel
VHWAGVTVLLGALLVVLSWAAVECHRYFRGWHVIGAKQLAWRVIVAVLMAAVVAMILWGSFYRWKSATSEFLYWSGCLLLMLVVMLITIKDWRAILREQHLRRAQLYQRMQDELGSLKPEQAKKDE